MRLLNKTPFLAFFGCLFSLASASAQVTTDPVGYKTVTIKGDNSLNLVGIEFLNSPDFTGIPTAVGASTLTFNGVDFDALLNSGNSYFVDVVSGENEGVNTIISSWSGDTLTLGDDLSSLVTASTNSIRVHSLLTIGDIFGVGGDVLEGGSAITADRILMPNPTDEGLITIYYSTGGFAGVGWRQVGAGNTDKAGLPIYFTDGLYVVKKSAGDAELVFTGNVKMTSNALVVEQGFTPFSTVFPSGVTLGNSGLYDSESASSSITAGSAVTGDIIYADVDGNGQLELYYYSTGGFSGVGWRQVGSGTTDKGDTPLTSAFGVLRRNEAPVSISRIAPY